MKRGLFLVAPPLALGLLAFASPAPAQLLSDRTDGLTRVCIYAGATNLLTSARPREYRVGLGQNCPGTYPAQNGAMPAPSARLRTDHVIENERVCTYEEGGSVWNFRIAVARPCPLYAGMVDQGRAADRTQSLVPAAPSPPRPDQ